MITGLKLAGISAVLSAGIVSGLDLPQQAGGEGKLHLDRLPVSMVAPVAAPDTITVEMRDGDHAISTLVRVPAATAFRR